MLHQLRLRTEPLAALAQVRELLVAQAAQKLGEKMYAKQQQAEAAGFGNIRYANVFCIKKGTPEKEYPVFLLMADKL